MQEEVQQNEMYTEESNGEEQQAKPPSKNGSDNFSINFAIVGGLVGAGIGLVLNPEKTKNALRNLTESELAKTAGKEFRKTAQTLLAAQAQNGLNQLTAANGGISLEDGSPSYEELKQENKNLNERLEKIEQMLNELVESK